MWKKPSLVIEVAEFEGPRGLPDLFAARVDINRFKARFMELGTWTFGTRSLALLRAALENTPSGLRLTNLKSKYQGSRRSFQVALRNALEVGAVSIVNEVVRLSPVVRRIVSDSLAIEVKANSAPLALSHSWRYRTFAHRVAILLPNGTQDPAQIKERGVGLMKLNDDNITWAFRPKRIGPTLKTDKVLCEEVLLGYLFDNFDTGRIC